MPACPTCKAASPPPADNRFAPFCSRRCQLVDLAKWLDGDYRIPAEAESFGDEDQGSAR